VARANFFEKRMLNIPNNLYKKNKNYQTCLLLNDTDSTKGYGYGYGYGYDQTVKDKPCEQSDFKTIVDSNHLVISNRLQNN
jgi:hypothetical protein